MGHEANDSRFAKSDFYDKSAFLSTNVRPKQVVNFSRFSERQPDLIQKGGDAGIELGGKSEIFYDEKVKEKACMKRLNAGIATQAKTTNRQSAFANLYRQDEDFTPDYYDSVKIAGDTLKIKKNEKPFVDMKKQTKRDLSKLWQGSEFYKNIQRDNQRQDYIKNLLSESL